MEFHLAGHVRTLKDFLINLGIVTLGILIALGVEELAAAHHPLQGRTRSGRRLPARAGRQ